MLIHAPPIDLDLLIVGGLTVDRFADGSRAPGGSVLHAARAVARAGRRPGAVVLAGREAEAAAGLAELEGLGHVHLEPAERSIAFEHDEHQGGRRLRYLHGAGLLACPARAFRPAAVLYAPLADELGPGLGGQRYPGATTGAILQGWLRRLEPGAWVESLPLAAIPRAIRARLADCTLLVASTEDLAVEAASPEAQLQALRATFGPAPILVVTAGSDGAWMDAGIVADHRPVPQVIEGVSTVGAGDAFAAGMLLGLAGGADPAAAVDKGNRLAGTYLRARWPAG